MKKGCFVLMILLLGCGGCSPDSLIDNIDLPTQYTETQTGSNDTTTVAPKFNESVLAADSISGTTFDRTIQIVFANGGAQVAGDINNTVTVDGNHVTVNNTTDEKVIYELKGTAQDGSVKLYSSKKQALVLDGLDLTSARGAAINNQGKKKCFVVVKGTNTLKDAASYTSTPADEDEKAAFSARGN